MSASFQDVGENLRVITVLGSLDTEGTDTASARVMAWVAAPKTGVIINLSCVRSLASVGIRALIASAKTVHQRGGKLAVVVAPGSTVSMSLEATGVDELMPVFTGSRAAKAAVLN
jgi:anti-anti-sigma factor